MIDKVKSWWEDLDTIKACVTLLGVVFTIGGVYTVLSYRVDASETQIRDTNDKVAIMVTDVAVIRANLKNSERKIDSMEKKIDQLIFRLDN